MKREEGERQDIAFRLVELSPGRVDELPLDEKTRVAIHTAQGCSHRVQRRRAILHVATLLRTASLDELREVARRIEMGEAIRTGSRVRLVEAWAESLLENESKAIGDLLELVPHLDVSRLRQLVRNLRRALAEANTGKASGAQGRNTQSRKRAGSPSTSGSGSASDATASEAAGAPAREAADARARGAADVRAREAADATASEAADAAASAAADAIAEWVAEADARGRRRTARNRGADAEPADERERGSADRRPRGGAERSDGARFDGETRRAAGGGAPDLEIGTGGADDDSGERGVERKIAAKRAALREYLTELRPGVDVSPGTTPED
jgi:ribosome-associated protein